VKKILVLPGDGIGQEVVSPAVAVMQVAAQQQGVTLDIEEALVGGAAIDDCGEPLPAQTLAKAKEADAVLLGGVGGPKWDDLPTAQRPEKGLLGLRQELGLFANLRPALLASSLASASSLKPELVSDLVDAVVELAEDPEALFELAEDLNEVAGGDLGLG